MIYSFFPSVELSFQIATPADASELVRLHTTVNEHLTSIYGRGPWSSGSTEKGVLFSMRNAKVCLGRERDKLIATFRLCTKKPWAIDKTYFSACKRPLYLTSMAVHPGHQRQSAGTRCIQEARRIAAAWPGDAIRLDAFDAAAGAGEFYRKCNFREVGRTSYRNAPLIYFEMLL